MPERIEHPDPPAPNPDLELYWEGVRRGELLYQRCESCQEVIFHPRMICPYCLGDRLVYEKSAGRGKVYSFTVQYYALSPAWEAKLPYALGIVALDEGYHMFSELVPADLEVLRIGAPVEVWFDRVDDKTVLPKFRIVSSDQV